jgi:peptide deformylase
MAPYVIRTFGDPVLKQRAAPVRDIDGSLAVLSEDMIETMRAAPGLGLAAPQVGVMKRLFVYQLPEDEVAKVLINPVISESRGEWEFEEGCLSVPGLYFPIVRPNEVHVTGFDLDGNEVSIEASELAGRLFQHELDHLDGKLLLEYLEPDQRKVALRELRRRAMEGDLTAGQMERAGGGVRSAEHRGL